MFVYYFSVTIPRIQHAAGLEHATIRDNILFGTPLDQDRYQAVLDACALGPDLALLEAGDMTGMRCIIFSEHSLICLKSKKLVRKASHFPADNALE